MTTTNNIARDGVEWFTDLSRFFVPGKAKGFSLDELEAAKTWIISEE